jgi:hypothetical protein
MDADLTFPAPHVPDPPSLLDALLVELLEDSDVHHIPLSHPLTTDDLPNSEASRVLIHTLACLREALASLFNTPDHTLS